MAYKPVLSISVEWNQATFVFGSPDKAWSRFTALLSRVAVQGLTEEQIEADPPPDMLEVLAEMFVEGVVDWQGVEGEEAPLACNLVNRKAIPFMDKVEVAKRYVAQCGEVREKKEPSPPAPMTSTPPGEQTDESSSATTPPDAATTPETDKP